METNGNTVSSSYKGLTTAQVEESRRLYGVNMLTPKKKKSSFKLFLAKFEDPLIIILLIAGILSIAISVYEYIALNESLTVFFEPVGIFVAIILATGLAFIFEWKAEKEFAILNQISDEEPVTVVRDGQPISLPRKDLVVDDFVILSTGDEIPADGWLITAVNLAVDESTLTGELICNKSVEPEEFDKGATYPTNKVLRGTKIMEGHGTMRISEVGDTTEQGKVFIASTIDDSIKTPLDNQLARLSRMITIISYITGIVIIVGRMILWFLHSESSDILHLFAYLLQSIMIAVTLVVVAVPEGLPMAVTLSLAYSMRRMLKTNNLVRKLHACETMGATTVICTDKTGTLTKNRMQVNNLDLFIPAFQTPMFIQGLAVNSTAMLQEEEGRIEVLGNPTEGALLLWLREKGYDYKSLRDNSNILKELPFTTERKYMATEISSGKGRKILYVKGAPEIILSLCEGIDDELVEDIKTRLSCYQNQAMRTLGFAMAEYPEDEELIKDDKVIAPDLEFTAITAISDPVREEVPEAVREVKEAGVKIKIVTGDTTATACKIAEQIGLDSDGEIGDEQIITGPDFEKIPDKKLAEVADRLIVIARARPMDKKRLVEALQSKGEVVAVTGDGTNDAPALKAAHVGLSMGDGTSVAKEASDITIIDNSFSSIVRAVMWGRSLYRNIQRFILFQTTVNVVASLIVLAGAFMSMESPLSVTQMLWVNLIMDTFAAMALASLPPDHSVMKDKPRSRSAFIISVPMWKFIIWVGLAMFIILWGFLYYLQHVELNSVTEIFSVPYISSHSLSPYELSLFFTVFVFMQFWNIFNAKSFASGSSSLHFKGCSGFIAIVLTIFIGQILIVSFGGEVFSVVPLSLTDWIIIILGTSPILIAGEIIHKIRSHHS